MIAGLDAAGWRRIRFASRRVDLLLANASATSGSCSGIGALLPHMTVAENVAFGLGGCAALVQGRPKKRVDEYISLVRLDGLARSQARPALRWPAAARCRGAGARLRPRSRAARRAHGQLDAKLREQVRLDVRAIQRRAGQNYHIFVTHDQVDEALVLSDLVVLMNQGAIEQIGPPRTSVPAPATEFAALRFIGANNLIPGHYLGNDAAQADGVPARPSPLRRRGQRRDHGGGPAGLVCVRAPSR